MDKQKQIEEMAKDILRAYAVNKLYSQDVAKALYEQGYRKIPEGAVVLTSNQKISLEHEWYCLGYEQARKETAEKFAERLKENETIKEIAENGYIVSYVKLCEKIDEICKELVGGDTDE